MTSAAPRKSPAAPPAWHRTGLTPPSWENSCAGTRGAIGNKIHWVRDVTFNEDTSTLRTGTAPQAMAIRNTLVAAFRLTGWTNLKQARRHFSHATSRCADLITKPLKTVKLQT